jgi:hypothetical protein
MLISPSPISPVNNVAYLHMHQDNFYHGPTVESSEARDINRLGHGGSSLVIQPAGSMEQRVAGQFSMDMAPQLIGYGGTYAFFCQDFFHGIGLSQESFASDIFTGRRSGA